MIQKIFLVFRTVRHLKIQQIVYQVYYRLKPIKTLRAFQAAPGKSPVFNRLHFSFPFNTSQQAVEGFTFKFLNLEYRFPVAIDWEYQGFGKLWNYNLQYFDYLRQQQLTNTQKQNWLIDIGQWLNDGRLKLEPYPVSLRTMNTIRFLSGDEIIGDVTIVKDLFAQLQYLNGRFEYHLLGNHLLENAFALFMGGHVFNRQNWQKKAKEVLYKELKEQVLEDGGHFEMSPMYHQVILFRVLELIDWYSQVKNPDTDLLNFIKEKASRMLGWLQVITFKNGDIPYLNDSAVNIAFTSGELFKFAALLKLDTPEVLISRNPGYRKYNSGDYESVIDAAELGPSYQPGHSHADALSFILYKSGKPFIVEAGTSTYEAGPRRNYERSTAAHNSIVVNDCNQSEVWGAFRAGRRASATILSESAVHLEACHNGYQHNFGILHKRRFDFAPDTINISDHIGQSDGKLFIHFHPDCEVLQTTNDTLTIKEMGSVHFENAGKIVLKEYQFANGFNQYKKAVKVEVDFTGKIKTSIQLS